MLLLQFRLFFIWLTKSLRQLNGDSGPQANQLPAIDRWVHFPFCRKFSWMDEVVLRAIEFNYIILCVWQCRGCKLFTHSLREGPCRPTPCTRHRWPCHWCETVSYFFSRKCNNSSQDGGVFCSFFSPGFISCSDQVIMNTLLLKRCSIMDSSFFSWILGKRRPGWRS